MSLEDLSHIISDPPPDLFDLRARKYTPERVALFNEANRNLPDARLIERNLMLDRLRLKPGLTVCDAAAGGGYLAEGIHERLEGQVRIFCVENSESFAATINPHFHPIVAPLGRITLPDNSMDRVACLAGLHHLERKIDFFREGFRLLLPGGCLAVADALIDSPSARFLNGPVDHYSDLGHDGMFLVSGMAAALMEEAGFAEVEEREERYFWHFGNSDEMVSFCRLLFRMQKATLKEVERSIHEHLEVIFSEEGTLLAWSLSYASGSKPGEPEDK